MSDVPDYGPYHDYPNEPIGGSNPYYRCCACGASDPAINGTLSGHFQGCSWVKKKRVELGGDPPLPPIAAEIQSVQIHNWQEPGGEWWAHAEKNPDEPLIELSARMKMTFRQYQRLLQEGGGPSMNRPDKVGDWIARHKKTGQIEAFVVRFGDNLQGEASAGWELWHGLDEMKRLGWGEWYEVDESTRRRLWGNDERVGLRMIDDTAHRAAATVMADRAVWRYWSDAQAKTLHIAALIRKAIGGEEKPS